MQKMIRAIESMQEDLIGQGISFLIELENIYGKEKFFKYVYKNLSTELREYFPQQSFQHKPRQKILKRPEVLIEYPPSKIDSIVKIKDREEKIDNLERLKAALD